MKSFLENKFFLRNYIFTSITTFFMSFHACKVVKTCKNHTFTSSFSQIIHALLCIIKHNHILNFGLPVNIFYLFRPFWFFRSIHSIVF